MYKVNVKLEAFSSDGQLHRWPGLYFLFKTSHTVCQTWELIQLYSSCLWTQQRDGIDTDLVKTGIDSLTLLPVAEHITVSSNAFWKLTENFQPVLPALLITQNSTHSYSGTALAKWCHWRMAPLTSTVCYDANFTFSKDKRSFLTLSMPICCASCFEEKIPTVLMLTGLGTPLPEGRNKFGLSYLFFKLHASHCMFFSF